VTWADTAGQQLTLSTMSVHVEGGL